MKLVGRDITAEERWKDRAAHYADTIDSPYHQNRLMTIKLTLHYDEYIRNKVVVDFGCGEGVLSAYAAEQGAKQVIGIDIEPSLLDMARAKVPNGDFRLGSLDRLKEIPAKSVDCLISANVLAYMTEDENRHFYDQVRRIVKKDGALVVTHSNELFDMFTFNAYTAEFCKRNFGFDPSPLLVHPDKPERLSFATRENPLEYPEKIGRYGLRMDVMHFMNFHGEPPLLSGEDPDDMARPRVDTTSMWPQWKLMFRCSMFAVRAFVFV